MGSRRVIQAVTRNTLTGRLVTAREFLRFTLGKRQRLKVGGDSMLPTARGGDYVLVDPAAYETELPQTGDLVVATHPHGRNTIIKRVTEVAGTQVWLSADNAVAGQDSRHFGAIDRALLRGRVTAIIA